MSDTAVKEKAKTPGMPQLAAILCLISAVCALLLGLVNMITVDPIQKAKEEKTARAMNAVLAADSYEPVEYTGDDALVLAAYRAGDAGYVVEVSPSGFGGAIDMVVGVDNDGNVTGVSIIKSSETSGLGSNASKPAFNGQYTGKAGPFSVTKDGGEIQAITGATITSRAVSKGVNAAVEAAKTLG